MEFLGANYKILIEICEFPEAKEGHRKNLLIIVKGKDNDNGVVFTICECKLDKFKDVFKKWEDWVKRGKKPKPKFREEIQSYIG